MRESPGERELSEMPVLTGYKDAETILDLR